MLLPLILAIALGAGKLQHATEIFFSVFAEPAAPACFQTASWAGAVSAEPSDRRNWSPQFVPTQADPTIVLGGAARRPVFNRTTVLRSLTLLSSADLTSRLVLQPRGPCRTGPLLYPFLTH